MAALPRGLCGVVLRPAPPGDRATGPRANAATADSRPTGASAKADGAPADATPADATTAGATTAGATTAVAATDDATTADGATDEPATVDDATLARALAALCRARRQVLVVAGDARLAAAMGAGEHLRRGRRAGHRPRRPLLTASAHTAAELRRARRAGCDAVFLSPVFATASHPGARPLGATRWAALARGAGLPVLALGGVTGRTARGLPRFCAGAGAISALR